MEGKKERRKEGRKEGRKERIIATITTAAAATTTTNPVETSLCIETNSFSFA